LRIVKKTEPTRVGRRMVTFRQLKIGKTRFTLLDNGTEEDNYIAELLIRYLVTYWSMMKRDLDFLKLEEIYVSINPPWARNPCQVGYTRSLFCVVIISWKDIKVDEIQDVLTIGFLLRHELYHVHNGPEELELEHPYGFGLEFSYAPTLCVFIPNDLFRYKPVETIDIPMEILFCQIKETR